MCVCVCVRIMKCICICYMAGKSKVEKKVGEKTNRLLIVVFIGFPSAGFSVKFARAFGVT